MSRHYYRTGADGRRYCYDVHPTYRCANARALDPGAKTDAQRLAEAAETLGCESSLLEAILHRAHGPLGARRRRDPGGRLTEICEACGRRLDRLGFAYFITAAVPPNSPIGRIGQGLGVSGYQRVQGPWYAPTKRVARDWAHTRASGPAV